MVANKISGLYQESEAEPRFYNLFRLLVKWQFGFRVFDVSQQALASSIDLNQAQRH